MDSCPIVKGSKEPGKIAMFILSADIDLILVKTWNPL
jgi:hypothetical protein